MVAFERYIQRITMDKDRRKYLIDKMTVKLARMKTDISDLQSYINSMRADTLQSWGVADEIKNEEDA